MEDDLDEGAEVSVSHMAAQASLEGSEPGPSCVSIALVQEWGQGMMPQEIENKCRGQRRFVTRHTRLQKLCLDPDVLHLAVRNCGNIRNDREDNRTRSFRKASYRQYVLNRYGYLGKGNSESVPLMCS